MMKKLTCKYYDKWTVTHENRNVQSHDQEENNLNKTIDANSDARTLTHSKIIKRPFNKINVAAILTANEIPTKILLLAPVE